MRPQFSINQSRAFVDSSVAAEDIVPRLPAGQRGGGFRYFRAELSRRSEKKEERLGVGSLVWLSEAPPKTETTGMVIQTKETRDYRGSCWTDVEDCNLPGVC